MSGGYAYVAAGKAGMHMVSIGTPTTLKRVGGNLAMSPEHLTIHGDKVYVGAGTDGLMILSLFRPPLRMATSLVIRGGLFRMAVSGQPGSKVRVQRSSNLRDWEDWESVTLGQQPIELSDSDTLTAPNRFYRAAGR